MRPTRVVCSPGQTGEPASLGHWWERARALPVCPGRSLGCSHLFFFSAFLDPGFPSLCPPLFLCSPFQHLLWLQIWIFSCPGRLKVSPSGAGPLLCTGFSLGLGLHLPNSPLQALGPRDTSCVASPKGDLKPSRSWGLGKERGGLCASHRVVNEDTQHSEPVRAPGHQPHGHFHRKKHKCYDHNSVKQKHG